MQNALGHEVGHSAHGLANNAMTPEQRATLSPSDPEYEMRVIGSKIQVAGWTCYVTLMMALKVAMCYFFLRLTVRLRSLLLTLPFSLMVSNALAERPRP